jgi:hypothetical protein
VDPGEVSWPVDLTLRGATFGALAVFVLLGSISNLLFLAAFQVRVDWFTEPARLIEGGERSAVLLRWAALTDLFSYYLPTAVVATALFIALRRRGPVLAAIASTAALAYVVAGGTAAATLSVVGPALIVAHASAGPDQATLELAFRLLVDVVFRAVWQLFDGIMLTVWFAGTGLLVLRDQPGFGRLGLALGVIVAVGTALTVLGLGLMRDIGLGLVFVMWFAWAIWLAKLIWRRQPPFDHLEAADIHRP